MKYDYTLFEWYLEILGVKKKKPSLGALKELVKAHLYKVPFENISKLYYKKAYDLKSIPDLPQYLNGIEKQNFGGTCYSNNYYLNLLLNYLDYDAKLCGADMNNPDVHIVSIVNLNDGEFIIDVGYAAPFTGPMSRNLNNDLTITLGNEKYILKPKDENGYSRLEQYWRGELKHGYIAKPQPRKIEEFKLIIEDSFKYNSTFMNAVMIARFFENGSLVLRNLSLVESKGNDVVTTAVDRKDVPIVAEEKFGIPSHIVKKAISELGDLRDTWD